MQYSKSVIATAVAGVLASAAANAAPIAQGTAYQVRLVIAGSSAAQGTFASEVAKVCGTDLATYNSSGGSAAYQAYACTLQTNTNLKSASGKTAIFYYRADGGSVLGVVPFVPSTSGFAAGVGSKVNRLDDTASTCTLAGSVYTCPLGSAYNGNTDAVASGLVKDNINIGVSDLEPGAFTGENWGTAFTFAPAAPSFSTLNAIPHVAAFNQVFSVIVSNAGVTANITNLSRQSLANIFSGVYADWSQVPTDNTGTKALNGDPAVGTATSAYGASPITVCRRDPGSGTQAGASIIFEDQGCNGSAPAFIVSPSNLGNPVVVNLATGAEGTCVKNGTTGNAIGYVVTQAAPGSIPAGTHYVSIDGIPGDQTRAALGAYPWMFELTMNHLSGSLAGTGQNDLYTYFLGQLSANSTDPASANIVSIPSSTNTPSLPLTYSTTNNIPVALGTRGGNSCSGEVASN